MEGHLKYSFSAATHVGDRETNQDNFSVCGQIPFASEDESYRLGSVGSDKFPAAFVLCDGIGSYESSAQTAVRTLETVNECSKDYPDAPDKAEWVRDAVKAVQQNVSSFLKENMLKGGNTLTMLMLDENEFIFTNVGDSPAFIMTKDNELTELSVRHNLATYKKLTGQPVEPDDSRYLIFSIGSNLYDLKHALSIKRRSLSAGDCFLLCSDGVTNELSEEEIAFMLSEKMTADEFVARAASNEGSDNCTAIVIYIEEDGIKEE